MAISPSCTLHFSLSLSLSPLLSLSPHPILSLPLSPPLRAGCVIQSERKYCGGQIKWWTAAKIIPRVPHCYCSTGGKNAEVLPLRETKCMLARTSVCRAWKSDREREQRKQRLLDRQGGFFTLAERREKQNVVKEGECKMMGGLQENNNEWRGRE